MRHWGLAAVGVVASLAVWLVAPSLGWAIAAAAFATWLLVGAALAGRAGPTLLAVLAIAATGVALRASIRIRAIEQAWPETRERLIRRASGQLNETLGAAVDQARDLAARGVEPSSAGVTDLFAALSQGLDRHRPESGVVVFDTHCRPLAWAGRHRLPPDPSGFELPELSGRITAFYVLLEARRQARGRLAVSHVLLAADSAVPDQERTVAADFLRATGTALEFYAPGGAPSGTDVFDYCLPSCAPTDGAAADTLFSVRVVPPSQGAAKLARQASGSRWISILLLLSLAMLGVVAGRAGRWLGVLGAAALLVLTPVGLHVGLATLFSSASYYLDTLGPLSASSGALLTSFAVVVLLLVPLVRRGRRPAAGAGLVLAAVVLASAPLVMGWLASAITPPTAEIGVGQWLSWELSLTVTGVAIGLVGVVALGKLERFEARWIPWAAWGLAAGLGIVGLLVWSPEGGWPDWYPLLWIPPGILALLTRPRIRLLVTLTVVAGAAAVLLTWAAVVRSRLILAERDSGRLSGGDPVAQSMLARFARDISPGASPRTAAELYRHWRRSPLSEEDYPAVLATWREDGTLAAYLALSELGLSAPLFLAVSRTADTAAVPVLQRIGLAPGVHYVIAIPFPDSAVVTVGVAPRSRLIPPVRVARFLRGERRLVAPYEMSLGEPVASSAASGRIVWRRDERWAIRGTRVLELPAGARHLHVEVPLGDVVPLLVRGALILILNVALVGVLWMLGEALVGGLAVPRILRESLHFRSYRSRLALALAGFFILPTLGFAAWSANRLRVDAERSRDLLIQQTLSDAAGSARQLGGLGEGVGPTRVDELAQRLGADLLWYESGQLRDASVSILVELGLLDTYLPPAAFHAFTVQDELEVTLDEVIAGQATRVGYRALGGGRDGLSVLAAPRLVDVQDLRREQEDLTFALLLVTIIGLGGAVGLATIAARSLAQPVESLRGAALAVGRSEPLPPFDDEIPTEFVSVVEAFERMARDVEASQQALMAARRRTATVLRNVATGVLALDESFHVVTSNLRAEQLLGHELFAGDPVMDRASAEWLPVWDWVREAGRSPGDTEPREFTVGSRQIRVQLARLTGAATGWVIALDDTTDLSRAVRVLAWGELARQIAHEIKNPLTPIRLGMQHLLRSRRDGRPDFDSTLERTSQQILAEIERLDAIARAFSRFGAPPAEAAALAPADLVAIARDAAELYQLGGGANVRVEAERSVEAVVRRDEVKEVLINLIENARDAGATEITIGVHGGDGYATVTVADDGRGIPPEILPRIFEPQFSTTTSGTGLGLAICKRLVESWGGEMEVESELRRGTVVRVWVGGGAGVP